MAMTLFGDKTPLAQIFKSESHKLAQAFNVEQNKVVKQGNPVVLLASGNIRAFEAGDTMKMVIGYAITDSVNPAYKESRGAGPVEVTVSTRGYMVLHGTAKAAITPGIVIPTGDMDATGKYSNYNNSTTEDTKMWALAPANPGEVTQILVG